MTGTDPAAALEQIRQRSEWASDHWAEVAEVRESASDVPLLLDAVEAVLELHCPADYGTGAQCKGCATHVTFTRWPCSTVRAITTALAGKDAGDG